MAFRREKAVQAWRLKDATTGNILIAHLMPADSLHDRLLGLMGKSRLAPDTGLWLPNTNGIHTFGMRFSIDVLVLDANLKVLRLCPALPPNRFLWPIRGGKHTLELAEGVLQASPLQIGSELQIEPMKG
jgi:uncharacterized membrane protein (UPF0127 family)